MRCGSGGVRSSRALAHRSPTRAAAAVHETREGWLLFLFSSGWRASTTYQPARWLPAAAAAADREKTPAEAIARSGAAGITQSVTGLRARQPRQDRGVQQTTASSPVVLIVTVYREKNYNRLSGWRRELPPVLQDHGRIHGSARPASVGGSCWRTVRDRPLRQQSRLSAELPGERCAAMATEGVRRTCSDAAENDDDVRGDVVRRQCRADRRESDVMSTACCASSSLAKRYVIQVGVASK